MNLPFNLSFFRWKSDDEFLPYPKKYKFQDSPNKDAKKQRRKQRKHKKKDASSNGLPKLWKSLEYQVEHISSS